jgi:hypothetical protein
MMAGVEERKRRQRYRGTHPKQFSERLRNVEDKLE